MAKNLGVGIILVKGAGHFNEKAGCMKFELLLEKIKEEIFWRILDELELPKLFKVHYEK